MRNFGDDFDDDGAGLDLETGSSVGAVSGDTSAYAGTGGLSLDDDLFGDGVGGALELDVPTGHKAAVSHMPQGHAPQNAAPASNPSPNWAPNRAPNSPSSLGGVPDLAFDAVPMPVRPATSAAPQARPSGSMAAVRPSGSMQAVHPATHPSGSYGAVSVSNMAGGPSSVQPAPLSAPAPASSPLSAPSPAFASAPPQATSGPPPSASMPVAPMPGVRPDAAAIIARYPDPPAQAWQAPVYAAKVLLRQFELRQDLVALRRRRSPDVRLYEAALGVYEPKTFRLGMTIGCAAFVVGTFLFFLPVILRFVRD
ncbi:hypothetical protein AKJ09_08918 [Labilithrix luteola]|uniref:Uncharacterized protein n=1 Tax=Labilithrix luteola TaxID=1391654 RepID=A0A0K1QA32_9BACT|nr:hypothetical protein [Labilithrix luteola]AKV02255.1 hypothetical protein AKJ09_08918 [Labilithrix luteola]